MKKDIGKQGNELYFGHVSFFKRQFENLNTLTLSIALQGMKSRQTTSTVFFS